MEEGGGMNYRLSMEFKLFFLFLSDLTLRVLSYSLIDYDIFLMQNGIKIYSLIYIIYQKYYQKNSLISKHKKTNTIFQTIQNHPQLLKKSKKVSIPKEPKKNSTKFPQQNIHIQQQIIFEQMFSNKLLAQELTERNPKQTTPKFEQSPEVNPSEQGEQIEEVSQFKKLKQQMNQIQYIASTEIKVLKEELLRANEEIMRLKQKSGVDVGVNTEQDARDEEIRVLREGLIRHVRINKQLTNKAMNKPPVPKSLPIDEAINHICI